MEETKCQLCSTHEIYEGLVAIGYDSEEAFHLSVNHLLENVLENAIETTFDKAYSDGFENGGKEGYEIGYEEGYNQATTDVAEVVVAYARSANES